MNGGGIELSDQLTRRATKSSVGAGTIQKLSQHRKFRSEERRVGKECRL